MTHLPVMLEETLHWLAPRPGGTVVDATLGYGGHAAAILPRAMPGGRLIGIDRDPGALAAAQERLDALRAAHGWPAASVVLRQGDFRALGDILGELGALPVDGLLVDLGVSSPQLETAARGFSFRESGPLDMRMDPGAPTSAADLVAELPEAELARILWEYGEERHSRRIAAAIARRRREQRIATTDDLARIVVGALPAAARHGRLHAATRTFQALRLAVNDELGALAELLDALPKLIAPGGRFVCLAYHSLEDRLVKRALERLSGRCQCPPELPTCQCGAVEAFRRLTRRPVQASEAEVHANPRARSAKLRAAERV